MVECGDKMICEVWFAGYMDLASLLRIVWTLKLRGVRTLQVVNIKPKGQTCESKGSAN